MTYTIGTGLTKTQSIFTYYDQNNVDLGTLDATDAFTVDSVGLRLSVDKPTTPDLPPTVLVNKVDLPNHSGTFILPTTLRGYQCRGSPAAAVTTDSR